MGQHLSAARLRTLGTIAVSAALAGCASGYSTFYRPAQGVTAEVIAQQRAGSPGEPRVERLTQAAEPQRLFDTYEKHGYVLIGSSTFNSDRRESDADAVAQGRKVGADLVVIVSPRDAGSTTSALPLRTLASDRNSPVTMFGAGSDVTLREDSRPRTYGTQTVSVAIAVRHTEFGAGYFIKRR